MGDDGFEILDADDNVKLFFYRELSKLRSINCDGRMQWLFEYF